MEHSICLNCDEPVAKKFCANCGQKTDTHRITLKHFLLHDVLHGVWHFEKGMLFTLKQTLFRPGKAALEYISGKRIRFYNVFYLSLLLIGLSYLLGHWHEKLVTTTHDEGETIALSLFQKEYVKYILFGFVPVIALNAKITFRKQQLNFAEHVIIAGIALLGILIIANAASIVSLLQTFGVMESFLIVFKFALFLSVFFFPVWVYANAFGKNYRWYSFTMRIIFFYVLFWFEYLAFLFTTLIILGENQIYIGFKL